MWNFEHDVYEGGTFKKCYSVTGLNNKLSNQLHGAESFDYVLRFPVYATWPTTTTTSSNNNNNNNNRL